MTNEQLDTILDFYKKDHSSIIKSTQVEWGELPKNKIFETIDVYNACRRELFEERYINDQGLTPTGNRFIGFVKTEEKRIEKEKKDSEILWYTKKTFLVSVIAVLIAIISLLKCSDSKNNYNNVETKNKVKCQ